MLFKRREPPSFGESVRVAVWPRRSWTRSIRYIVRRVSRLRATPHAIALGASYGVFASFTPFVGFHFVIDGIMAAVTRGSIIASAFGTFIGNPLTFPLIWIGTYKVGAFIIGSEGQFSGSQLREGFADVWSGIIHLSPGVMSSAVATVGPLIKPMLVGASILGTAVAVLSYAMVKRFVIAYLAEKRRVQEKAQNDPPPDA